MQAPLALCMVLSHFKCCTQVYVCAVTDGLWMHVDGWPGASCVFTCAAILIYTFCEAHQCCAADMLHQGIPPASLAKVSSQSLRDFITLCINSCPEKRPQALQLLKHEFFNCLKPGAPCRPRAGTSRHCILSVQRVEVCLSGSQYTHQCCEPYDQVAGNDQVPFAQIHVPLPPCFLSSTSHGVLVSARVDGSANSSPTHASVKGGCFSPPFGSCGNLQALTSGGSHVRSLRTAAGVSFGEGSSTSDMACTRASAGLAAGLQAAGTCAGCQQQEAAGKSHRSRRSSSSSSSSRQSDAGASSSAPQPPQQAEMQPAPGAAGSGSTAADKAAAGRAQRMNWQSLEDNTQKASCFARGTTMCLGLVLGGKRPKTVSAESAEVRTPVLYGEMHGITVVSSLNRTIAAAISLTAMVADTVPYYRHGMAFPFHPSTCAVVFPFVQYI